MSRPEIWYLFGLAAITLILLRLRPTQRTNFRDPVVISFTLGLFLAAFGTLSKQPVLAQAIDSVWGINSAWLVADGLFLIGLCAGTYWVDLMRMPDLRNQGWRLIRRWRVAALILVISWMVISVQMEIVVWSMLERGGIDVGGRFALLTGRLAYLGYTLWGLGYLSLHFYRQRRHMQDRFNYIRLTIPWSAITLAIAAPLLQLAGMLVVFTNPNALHEVWPSLWVLVSLIQAIVAILIVATFFPPAYHAISWLDKQILIRQLLRTRQIVAQSRPDLEMGPTLLNGRSGLIVSNPDQWLTTLVNELELAKCLMGKTTYEIKAPAGALMPDVTRYALHEEQGQFLRGLTAKEPLATPNVTGDTYALARWYAAVGQGL